MQPAVTVIIPAHNRAGMIGQALECLLRQTLPPAQVIVVDDGSTDDTAAVARGFGARVSVIQQANAGPGAARNRALAEATGEFVQFFDSDDLCTPDKLERQARALVESGADLAYGGWAHCWIEDHGLRVDPMGVQQGGVQRDPLSAMLAGWLTFMPASLVRRSWIGQVGGYPSARHTGEDIELLYRLVLAGVRLVHVPGPLLLVRQHIEGQISSASHLALMRAQDQVHLCGQIDSLLARHGARLSAGQRLAWRTWQWRAQSELARLDPATSAPVDQLAGLNHRLGQYRAGLRARLTGSRFAADFAPAPLTAQQREGIAGVARDLGLKLAV